MKAFLSLFIFLLYLIGTEAKVLVKAFAVKQN